MDGTKSKAHLASRSSGFTLLELLIVIAIIGVLAAVAVPNYQQARTRANRRACYAHLKSLAGAIEMFGVDTKTKITSMTDGDCLWKLRYHGYLCTVPADPGERLIDPGRHYHMDGRGRVFCEKHGRPGATKETKGPDLAKPARRHR